MNIRIENLSKKYKGKYALKDFSVTLENGVYGLLGTNGAGKTTFLNVFMGVIAGDGGEIYVDGVNIRELGASFISKIGYLPQMPRFYRDFTVREFMRYMYILKDMSRKEGEARTDYLLDTVNLTEAANKKVGALSGGMRQRLGIAQAMLSDPGVLILDEPTAGLDPRERIRFRNLLSKFAGDRIIIIATHIVSDIEFIADRIILVHEGHLLTEGSPSELSAKLDGKVWSLELDTSDVPSELVHHTISNLAKQERGVRMRIISDEKPHPDAHEVPASLEEVFLFYCGEDV